MDKIGEKFEKFYEVIKRIRKECPWDSKQTHKTLEKYLIEESYEFIDAVERDDYNDMYEELGDILLQIGLHAAIGEEKDEFSMEDVIDSITEKIIRRHPHVFGENKLSTADEVKEQWEEIKKKEGKKKHKIEYGPALIMAMDIQKKASKDGFDWDSIEGVYDKLHEEIEELKNAKNDKEKEEELGDILFVLAHLANWLNIDAELALVKGVLKFRRRYEKTKELIEKDGLDMKKMSIEELDRYWDKSKEIV